MPQVAEKAPVSHLVGTLELAPVGTRNLPALRAETALATIGSPLDTYRAMSGRFAQVSSDVGAFGGSPIVGPSDWQYFWRLVGPSTAGSAGVTLLGTAVVDALATSVSFSFVPAVLAGGAVLLGTALWGAFSVDSGDYRRRREAAETQMREARGQRPLDAERVAFVKERFDAAQPVERALIGSLAEHWLKELDERRVIGKNVRDVLRGIAAEAAGLPAVLTGSSKRITAVAKTICDASGATIKEVDAGAAKRIVAACTALTDDEQALLLQEVRDLLFDGEKPRVSMAFDACQTLLEGLVPRPKITSDGAARL